MFTPSRNQPRAAASTEYQPARAEPSREERTLLAPWSETEITRQTKSAGGWEYLQIIPDKSALFVAIGATREVDGIGFATRFTVQLPLSGLGWTESAQKRVLESLTCALNADPIDLGAADLKLKQSPLYRTLLELAQADGAIVELVGLKLNGTPQQRLVETLRCGATARIEGVRIGDSADITIVAQGENPAIVGAGLVITNLSTERGSRLELDVRCAAVTQLKVEGDLSGRLHRSIIDRCQFPTEQLPESDLATCDFRGCARTIERRWGHGLLGLPGPVAIVR